MNVQPVIQREVRVASRRRETWWLRLAFAGGALGAFLLGMVWPDTRPAELGRVVLVCLCVAGFALSLFAGPYLTADAICRERREGTLGLLFLTPLNAWQIVTGKMATHTLQVGYGWVAVFPVFFLPVLLGGVLPGEVIRLLLVLLVTLLLSVGFGLFWSTVCAETRNAVMATVLSMLLLVFLPWIGVLMEELLRGRYPSVGLSMVSPLTALIFAFESPFSRGPIPGFPWSFSGSDRFWFSTALQMILTVTLLATTCVLLPRIWRRTGSRGGRVAATAANRPGHAKSRPTQAWLPTIEASPLVWFFGRTLQNSGWLRALNLFIWIMFVVMLLLTTTRAAEEAFITAFGLAYARHLILRVHFAFNATHQLQEDRGSGALELLMTTPVKVAQLAAAHQEALRRSVRRALVGTLMMNVLLEAWIFLLYDHLDMNNLNWLIFSVWFIGGGVLTLSAMKTMRWLAIRQVGTAHSQLKAAGILLATIQLPAWIAFATAFLMAVGSGEEAFVVVVFLSWLVVCLVYNAWLVRRCENWLRTHFRRQVAGDR